MFCIFVVLLLCAFIRCDEVADALAKLNSLKMQVLSQQLMFDTIEKSVAKQQALVDDLTRQIAMRSGGGGGVFGGLDVSTIFLKSQLQSVSEDEL
jgi:diaminopimelate decarboxylase